MDFKIVMLVLVATAAALGEDAAETQTLDPSKQLSARSSAVGGDGPQLRGVWRKRVAWRARWVKGWRGRKVYEAMWRKNWGPVLVQEWVPLPRPPPGWVKPRSGPLLVKQLPT